MSLARISRRIFLKKVGISAMTFKYLWPFSSAKGIHALPRVLIIGDSISIGYMSSLQEALAGRAEVIRPMKPEGKAENCQGTTHGVLRIEEWLGKEKWDLIHFNFGLHDLKHVDPITGKNSKNPNHPRQASPKQYKKNLKQIIKHLKATEAKLVFATTTPYPDKVAGPLRLPEESEVYNKLAKKLMRKQGILVNDLHAFVLPQMAELQRPENVHFTKEGSEALGKRVAGYIETALENQRPLGKPGRF